MAGDETVIEAQSKHHLTHPAALREAVDTLVRHLGMGVTILVQPETADPGDRVVAVVEGA